MTKLSFMDFRTQLMSIAAAILLCSVSALAQRPANDVQRPANDVQRPANDAQQPNNNNELLTSVKPTAGLYAIHPDANKEIQEALTRATSEHKRVLLVFGADWCYDCHVLDHALHEGEAGKIVAGKYLLVHVDIGEGDKNAELISQYKIPLDKGVPAVAVVDADGKLLYSSGDGEFEAARRMLKKDLVKFLTRWGPIP